MSEVYVPVFQLDEDTLAGFPIDVLWADDSDLMRHAIKGLLDVTPGINVVGETKSLAQTLNMTAALRPTAVLMDMPGFIRAELLSSTKHLIAISLWNDEESKTLAEDYGATIFLDKSTLATELVGTMMELRSEGPTRE
jgi:DNA-binding NarL/FixJ family response regulator